METKRWYTFVNKSIKKNSTLFSSRQNLSREACQDFMLGSWDDENVLNLIKFFNMFGFTAFSFILAYEEDIFVGLF